MISLGINFLLYTFWLKGINMDWGQEMMFSSFVFISVVYEIVFTINKLQKNIKIEQNN